MRPSRRHQFRSSLACEYSSCSFPSGLRNINKKSSVGRQPFPKYVRGSTVGVLVPVRFRSRSLLRAPPKTEGKMCDCPTGGVFTKHHETHRSWIIFKECKTENGSKSTTVEAGIQSTPDGINPDLDSMYLLLEPHLRPATPDYEDQKSVVLFEEHKQLAQEYLKVQTEMALLSQKKSKLLAAQTQEQQQQRKVLKDLQAEKESLILVRELLSRQKENNNQQNSDAALDNWVLVPRDGDNLD